MIDGKADKEHVHEQYLTEHQSLEGYAKTEELSNIVEQYFRENPVSGGLTQADREKLDAISINDTVITVNPSGGQEVELLTT